MTVSTFATTAFHQIVVVALLFAYFASVLGGVNILYRYNGFATCIGACVSGASSSLGACTFCFYTLSTRHKRKYMEKTILWVFFAIDQLIEVEATFK